MNKTKCAICSPRQAAYLGLQFVPRRPRAALALLRERFSALLTSPDAADADVVVGAGLWLMWPVPFVAPSTRWTTYPKWAAYDATVAQLLALGRAGGLLGGGDGRLVVAATHAQCEERFRGNWGALVREAC